MCNYEELKEKILYQIKENQQELFDLNVAIVNDPELSAEEFRTSARIVELLKNKGYEVEYPFAGQATAFRACSPKKSTTGEVKPRRYRVALMAEYDALPEIGHGCGHSLSGAISCLAGIALKEYQDLLDTDVEIIGTPAEETYGGKIEMDKKGVWKNYDMAMMIHLYNQTLAVPLFMALNEAVFTFFGKAAHASAEPWNGINALNAVQLMFHSVDMLRQHVRPDVRIHGVIKNGGLVPGIVPEKAVAEFYVRALDKDRADRLSQQLERCAEGACLATGASYKKEIHDNAYYDLKHNPTGEKSLCEVMKELDIHESGDPSVSFGSSDAGNVSYSCPTFHPMLKLAPENVDVHTKEFADMLKTEKAQECLQQGAAIIALQVAKIFSDEDKIRCMQNDFNEKSDKSL